MKVAVCLKSFSPEVPFFRRLKLGAIHHHASAAGVAATNDFAFFLNRDRSADRAMHLSYSVERSRDAVGNFALPLGASFGIQWREWEK